MSDTDTNKTVQVRKVTPEEFIKNNADAAAVLAIADRAGMALPYLHQVLDSADKESDQYKALMEATREYMRREANFYLSFGDHVGQEPRKFGKGPQDIDIDEGVKIEKTLKGGELIAWLAYTNLVIGRSFKDKQDALSCLHAMFHGIVRSISYDMHSVMISRHRKAQNASAEDETKAGDEESATEAEANHDAEEHCCCHACGENCCCQETDPEKTKDEQECADTAPSC